MSKVNLDFGMIKIFIESDKTSPFELMNIACCTLATLLPEVKTIAKLERKDVFAHQLKLNKLGLGAYSDNSEESDDEECSKKIEKVNNLYV